MVFTYLNNKYKGKFSVVLKVNSALIFLSLIAIVAMLFYSAFILSILLIYLPMEYVFKAVLKSSTTAAYISLTLTIILFVYIPEKLGYRVLLLLLEHIGEKNTNLSNTYLNIVKALRIKLMIYFISFALVLLSSIETFYSKDIIQHYLWIQLKPVILQSVVTVIAFDRFLSLLNKEWDSINCDIRKVFDKLSLTLIKGKGGNNISDKE